MRPFPPTLLLLACVSIAAAAEDNQAATKPAPDVVFRAPFTLKLHVDKERYYEEKMGKIPYVHDNDVYLFKGEEFGITCQRQDGAVRAVKYQPDIKKADVTLKFTQEITSEGKGTMLLVIGNRTDRTLLMDGLMAVPTEKKVFETNILPVKPGLTNYEGWPHPIVQLVLTHIRLK